MILGNLYFEDADGNLILVKESIQTSDSYREITKYVRSIMPDFHIYYIRTWSPKTNFYKFDFGSYSEFFIWKVEDK